MNEPKYTTLQEYKEWTYIDSDDEDAQLLRELSIAEKSVETKLQRPLSDLADENGSLPEDLEGAILMYAANLHNNREATAPVAMQAVPYGFMDLITPYIKFS